jgi:hypothetical protein
MELSTLKTFASGETSTAFLFSLSILSSKGDALTLRVCVAIVASSV